MALRPYSKRLNPLMTHWRFYCGGLILLAGALWALAAGFGADPAAYLAILGPPIAATAAVVVAGWLLGGILIPRGEALLDRLALALPLGMGIVGLVFTIALLIPVFPLWIAFTVLFLFAAGAVIKRQHRLPPSSGLQAAGCFALALLLGGLAMAFLAALTPAVSYDVLEYHLPLVEHWLSYRMLDDVPFNFYTRMPSGAEALFATAAWLARDVESAAKMMNFALLGATALGVAALARRLGASAFFAILAAAIFCVHPTTVRIYVDAFADMGAAMYAVGTVLALMAWSRGRSWAMLAAAGALAGFAMGAKSSSAGLLIAPALGFIMLAAWRASVVECGGLTPHCLGRALLAPLVFGAVAAAVFLPWSIRGWFLTGNPASPFLNEFFGAEAWAAQTEELWLAMHGWSAPLSLDHIHTFFGRIGAIGWAWMAGAAAAAFLCMGVSRAIAWFVFAGYAAYTLLAHAPDRFAAPLIAMAIAATAAAASAPPIQSRRAWRAIALALFLLLAVDPFWGAAQNMAASGNIGHAATLDGSAFRRRFIQPYELFEAAQALPEGSQVLALYEARGFAMGGRGEARWWPPRVFNTVFDRSPILEMLREDSAMPLAQALKQAGFTHLLVNEIELARLIDTHASPQTAASVLYRQAHSIDDRALRYATLARRPQWYLPYERMEVAESELAAIEELIGQAAQRPIYRLSHPSLRVFLAEIP